MEPSLTTRKDKLRVYGITQQPIIVAIGSATTFEAFYVVINNIKYRVDDLMTAVDLCFKSFHTLNATYPKECAVIWEFLESFVYNCSFKSDAKRRGKKIVSTTLWTELQQI